MFVLNEADESAGGTRLFFAVIRKTLWSKCLKTFTWEKENLPLGFLIKIKKNKTDASARFEWNLVLQTSEGRLQHSTFPGEMRREAGPADSSTSLL